MSPELDSIIRSTIAAVGVNSIIIFLLRSWLSERIKSSISHEYSSLLERYKSELKLDTERQLANHKHELDIRAKDYEISKKYIHEKMATAIVETNDHLWNFLNSVHRYVTIYQGSDYKDPSKLHSVLDEYRNFVEKFKKNQLYLPDDLVIQIENFITILRDKSFDYQNKVVHLKEPDAELKNWSEIDKYINEEGHKIYRSIQSEFKDYLGVSNL